MSDTAASKSHGNDTTMNAGAGEKKADDTKALFNMLRINGWNYPGMMDRDKVLALRDKFETRESDVFVVTFPKCGTTMTQQVLHLLNHNGEQPETHMMAGIPWLEKGVSAEGGTLNMFDDKPEPRMFKTHAAPDLFPGDWRKPRLIFVTRNPKDAYVSLYHHMKNKPDFDFDGDWATFFGHMQAKEVENSDFFDWTLPWYERYRDGECRKALWLHYEDAIADMPAYVKKIAEFLEMGASDQLIRRVADQCTLKAMKSNPKADCSWVKAKNTESEGHLRRGGSGGWRDYFTVAQNTHFDEYCVERLTGSGLEYDYGM